MAIFIERGHHLVDHPPSQDPDSAFLHETLTLLWADVWSTFDETATPKAAEAVEWPPATARRASKWLVKSHVHP